MTDKQDALAVSKKDSRIQPWGDRQDIRELSARIKLMAPGAQKLGDNEALALAQGAVAHGLDPFNGEIWYIPNSGLMAGIKGLRKAARNQIDGNFWTEFERITDLDELRELNIPENALAFKCILRDSETLLAYSDSYANLNSKNIPTVTILGILGTRPYTVGIGYYQQGERTKMTPAQVAMKRAEADAMKRRFDLPFATSMPGEGSYSGDWVEGEIVEVDDAEEEQGDMFPAAEEEAEPIVEYDINGNKWDEARIMSVMATWIEMKVIPPDTHTNHVANLLKHAPFGPSAPDKDIGLWGKYYRAEKDQDKPTAEAAKLATEKYELGDAPF